MLRYTSGAVLHGSNIREALEAASAILVAEGHPPITIVSGDREYDEQVAIFLARYVLVSQVNGRPVYDFRWWEGRQYARISSAGTVAAPSPTAPHIARIAADLGYPYNVRSTSAHRRLQQIAPGLGLTWTGQFFGEDWHWETNRGVGRIDISGSPAGSATEEALIVNKDDQDYIDGMGASVVQQVQANTDAMGASVVAQLAAVIAAIPTAVVNAPVQAQDAKGMLLSRNGKPVTYPLGGYVASTNARVGGTEVTMTDEQARAMANPIAAALKTSLVAAITQAAANNNAALLAAIDELPTELRQELAKHLSGA